MFSLRLAFRNLLRQKKRTLFTGLSMFVGFVLACISIGWAEGSYNNMIDSFTRNRLGHIQVHAAGYTEHPTLYNTIDDPGRVLEKIASVPDVTAAAPRIYTAGLVSVGEKSAGARIIGIDRERENRTTTFDTQIIAGSYFTAEAGQALLGKELATTLNASPGDSIVIVSQAADGSIANARYTIRGLLDTGNPVANRSSLYITLKDAQQLFVLEGRVHEIVVVVSSLPAVNRAADGIRRALGNDKLTVETWEEFAKQFYRAMEADKGGMYIMLVVVILIVAITVLNTILMAVLERQREYGVLRALGTRPAAIVKMVLNETFLLSIISVVLGSVVGFIVNYLLAAHGIRLAEPIEWGGIQLRVMKSEVNLQEFLLPGLTVIFTSLAVALFPALKAARTEPASTMRTF
ncbi:MAG TPA: ABC transporter permease [Spirochaetia bacterium]|nr:ABC transporter permease [Spirochaetia bacterium]